MCETDGFQKVKVDTVEQIQLQIHLNKYWGVSAGLDWNLPLERFGNVSIKKTNVSHRVDKLWEMAVPALFTAPQHTTIVFVQYLYSISYCICTKLSTVFALSHDAFFVLNPALVCWAGAVFAVCFWNMDLTRRDLTGSSIYLPLTTFVRDFDRKNSTIDIWTSTPDI